jgi:translation elongation factor EF-1alpha
VGDKIKFTRGGEDILKQEVTSIQVEHEKRTSAKKGDVIGLKTTERIREGAEVYKEK